MSAAYLRADVAHTAHERMSRAVDTFFQRGVTQFVTDMSCEIACAPDADQVALSAVSGIGMRDFTQIEKATSAVRLSAQVTWIKKGFNVSIECMEFFAIPFVPLPGVSPNLASIARCVSEGKLFPESARILLTPNWCSLEEMMALASSPSGVRRAFQNLYTDSAFTSYPVILSTSVAGGDYPRTLLGAVINIVPAPGVVPLSVLSRLYDGGSQDVAKNASSLSQWREYAASEAGVRRIGVPMRVNDLRFFRDVAVASSETEWGNRMLIN